MDPSGQNSRGKFFSVHIFIAIQVRLSMLESTENMIFTFIYTGFESAS